MDNTCVGQSGVAGRISDGGVTATRVPAQKTVGSQRKAGQGVGAGSKRNVLLQRGNNVRTATAVKDAIRIAQRMRISLAVAAVAA